jgi:hypothetical protein
MRSNCLFYAVGRRLTRGGTLIIEWSKYWPGPHFAWEIDGYRYEFVPTGPRVKRLLPPVWFEGKVIGRRVTRGA